MDDVDELNGREFKFILSVKRISHIVTAPGMLYI